MSNINSGGPAFPQSDTNYGGMSLRDVAALAALPAIIDVCRADTRHIGETSAQMFARKALEVADAFLAARNKEDDR